MHSDSIELSSPVSCLLAFQVEEPPKIELGLWYAAVSKLLLIMFQFAVSGAQVRGATIPNKAKWLKSFVS